MREVKYFWSIADLALALRRKEFSSVELTQMYLERAATKGAEFRTFRELTTARAMREARASDERRLKGASIGVLDGIPYGVKDLLATKGIPTRWGSPGHHDQIFDYDATVVSALSKQGAVLIGKLSMIELAGGGNYNVPGASDVGAVLCAWDKSRWAGGSSSGSGSATALGCLGFSIGSETSGSITCPSAFNGVTGFRPTYGRVSRYGAMPLSWTMDKIGPIARSAEDAGIVLSAIAGEDLRDPSSFKEPLRLTRRGSKPKIGLLKEDFVSTKAPACKRAYEDAVAVFKKLGYEIVEVEYPKEMPSASLIVEFVVAAEGASAHENFIRSERLKLLADANQVAGFTAALDLPAVDYLWAMRARRDLEMANQVWKKCDVIFSPVFYHGAVSATKPFNESWVGMGTYYGPENLLGWPAIAFPIGFEDGAPLGGQLIAPSRREDTCYQLAVAFQKETNWHQQRTPLA